jgi:formate dehydrogenase subunit gamma
MQQPAAELARFSQGERWVHKCLLVLMTICIATAVALYFGPVAIVVGRRHLMETIHVYSGIALLAPIIIGLSSRAFRRDLRRINRFAAHDWAWLRSRMRRGGAIPVGKFNAGQKLNSAFVLGSILVMLLTGLVMRFGNGLDVSWRTGATFVHDWIAYAIVIVILGHVRFALVDPTAREGLRTGKVPIEWAQREHALWVVEEQTASDD